MERDSTRTLFGKCCPTYLEDINRMSPEEQDALIANLVGDDNPKTPRTLVRSALQAGLQLLGGARSAKEALVASARYTVWFASQSPENARVYFQALTKLLPTELSGPGGSPLTIVVRREGGDIHDVEGALIDGRFVANPDAAGELPSRALEPVT